MSQILGFRTFSMLLCAFLLVAGAFGQETTAGLQGTVKDPTGALVANAKVVAIGTTLVGDKQTKTDASGYYRFANLPPGTYTVTVNAEGFATTKKEGLILEVGHLPSIDFALQVGRTETVVEVSGEAPAIDVTTNHTMTNVTEEEINKLPTGRSFQSVIQFAPAASNEPLAGSMGTSMGNGTGGQSPGSSGNGQSFGYSVAGGADAENAYLIEGQESADIIGGFSHTNVPMDFIQEVQVKTSGIESEHGGALGGVVNVVMKKGSNGFHGSVFTQFENDAMDGSPVYTGLPSGPTRYNPLDQGSSALGIDPSVQHYQPIKDKTSDVFPGFTLGGPLIKDRIWFFAAFNPELSRIERKIDYAQSLDSTLQPLGVQRYSQNTNTYYTNARIDVNVSKKVRLFASWLYQLQKQNGESLPDPDTITGFNPNAMGSFPTTAQCQAAAYCAGVQNISDTVPVVAFEHNLGYTAPNVVTNVGADVTLSPHLVATTRFGYFFQNYHDFGYPTNGVTDFWENNGQGASSVDGSTFPTNLQKGSQYFNAPQNINYTVRNAMKRFQFDQDAAWFHSGWGGTHNFKFGYQLNRSSNDLSQQWNQPFVEIFPGGNNYYFAAGSTGFTNCAALVATYQTPVITALGNSYGDPAGSFCTGTYGYAVLQDYGSLGKATSYNHAFFVQDSWSVRHGLTINAGVRLEKEYLPGEKANLTAPLPPHPISFGWSDKIAPRIGAAWDVFRDGRMKVFGSYGVFNDVMKLNLAISSFGGQFWNNCAYAMMDPNSLALLNPVRDSTGHYCSPVGGTTTQGNFGTAPPAGSLIFLENANERGTEGVTPGLKPYRQHESVFGVDYQLRRNLAFEARWDRRRLDHVIEDAALFDSTGTEVFTIVNPGAGFNAINTTCATAGTFGTPPNTISYPACPPDPKAARSYDGLELRLLARGGHHFQGMFSYTYSHLRGNYTGLSSTDTSDGGGGRNAPDNSRAFDETYFQFNANGGSSSGLLPTDRPNKFKGYGFYEISEGKRLSTDLGIFQFVYQGSPVSSYIDVGYSVIPGNFFAVYVEDRGKWVNMSGTTGNLTFSNASTRRTSWFTQSDLNFAQNYKISESKVLSFSATIPNALNQRAITAYYEWIDSQQFQSFLQPSGVPFYFGGVAYSAYEHPYDWRSLANADGIIPNSKYGQPYLYQLPRNIRLRVGFTF